MDAKRRFNEKPMRIISVTGGKGGIGKTTISANLAVAFAKQKKKVLLFDADLGLANIDVVLGLNPKKTLHDVLTGDCSLQEICIHGPQGIKIIPASSGIQKMAELSTKEYFGLIQSFSTMVEDIDIMIVDMASGISSQIIDFTNASQDIVVVICNDPASLMDSYAVIKILNQKYARNRFGIVVNKTKSVWEGYDVFQKFQEAVNKFININTHYLGNIPYDDFVTYASRERVSVVDKYPKSQAVLALSNICKNIDNWHDDHFITGGIHYFFERLVKM